MTSHGLDKRIFIHVDLDAFYAQVEEKRLGLIGNPNPLAVRQWNGLVAVNYPARSFGVNRFDPIPEALKKCPQLQLVHVATYAEGETEWKYHAHPVRSSHKVSLDPYRRESVLIMNVFARFATHWERGGVDEAFLDVTQEVDAMLQTAASSASDTSSAPNQNSNGDSSAAAANAPATIGQPDEMAAPCCLSDNSVPILEDWQRINTKVLLESSLDAGEDEHFGGVEPDPPLVLRRFFAAATLCAKMRTAVFEELGYRCSAGIASSKTIAKLASATHKPNQQTVVTNAGIAQLLKTMPIGKVRNFGGKFGQEVMSKLGVAKMGELWVYSLETLRRTFGDADGTFVFDICRGRDRSVLAIDKHKAKSILATKTFNNIRDLDKIHKWIHVLSVELTARIKEHFAVNAQYPKMIHLSYTGANGRHSKRLEVPFRVADIPSLNPNVISQAAIRAFPSPPSPLVPCPALPCSAVALAATNFAGAGGAEVKSGLTIGGGGGGSLARFLKPINGPRVYNGNGPVPLVSSSSLCTSSSSSYSSSSSCSYSTSSLDLVAAGLKCSNSDDWLRHEQRVYFRRADTPDAATSIPFLSHHEDDAEGEADDDDYDDDAVNTGDVLNAGRRRMRNIGSKTRERDPANVNDENNSSCGGDEEEEEGTMGLLLGLMENANDDVDDDEHEKLERQRDRTGLVTETTATAAAAAAATIAVSENNLIAKTSDASASMPATASISNANAFAEPPPPGFAPLVPAVEKFTQRCPVCDEELALSLFAWNVHVSECLGRRNPTNSSSTAKRTSSKAAVKPGPLNAKRLRRTTEPEKRDRVIGTIHSFLFPKKCNES